MIKEKSSKLRQNIEQIGYQAANVMGYDVQKGTDVTIEDMELLKWKADRVRNVGFEQSKGNLFEYIESAKLNRNLANEGCSLDKGTLTDVPTSRGGYGENTAPDDFRLIRDDKIVSTGQAKVNNSSHTAAQNFTNPKYKDMQRIAPVDQVGEIKEQLEKMYKKGEISSEAYKNAIENLNENGLMDPVTGVVSGGTTREELFSLKGADEKVSQEAIRRYAQNFEKKQFCFEASQAWKNGAVVGGVLSGVVSSVENVVALYNDAKNLKQALKDVGIEAVQGSIKGGTTGFLSSALRIASKKRNSVMLEDSSVSAVVAAGIVECGVGIYEYTKGEITQEQLETHISNATVKSISTVYCAKTIGMLVGVANPVVSMIVYSISGIIVSNCLEISNNAALEINEYKRLQNLYDEANENMKRYKVQIEQYFEKIEQQRKINMRRMLDAFDVELRDSSSIETILNTIINLSDEMQMCVKYGDFDDFSAVMRSDNTIVF